MFCISQYFPVFPLLGVFPGAVFPGNYFPGNTATVFPRQPCLQYYVNNEVNRLKLFYK